MLRSAHRVACHKKNVARYIYCVVCYVLYGNCLPLSTDLQAIISINTDFLLTSLSNNSIVLDFKINYDHFSLFSESFSSSSPTQSKFTTTFPTAVNIAAAMKTTQVVPHFPLTNDQIRYTATAKHATYFDFHLRKIYATTGCILQIFGYVCVFCLFFIRVNLATTNHFCEYNGE